jgi:hypothetical protein
MFFKKQKNKEDTYIVKDQENALIFALDANDEVVIRLSMQNLSAKKAIKFAEMLYLTSKGMYQAHIIDMLLDTAQKDGARTGFIKDVINAWSKYIDNERQSDYHKDAVNRPVVSPTKFYEIITQSGKAHE